MGLRSASFSKTVSLRTRAASRRTTASLAAFGTVAFGRMGSLASGNGTFGLLGSMSPFGTSWGQYAANASTVMSGFDRYDNTVTYATPAFAGFKVYAQYSFDTDTKDDYDGAGLHGVEGKSSVDRYYAMGLTYANGPLNLAAVLDQTNFSTTKWNLSLIHI